MSKRTRYTTRNLPVILTPNEKAEVADLMSNFQERLDFIENLKIEVKPLRAKITELNEEYRNGREKPVDCIIYMNEPEEGKKTIIRTDSNEVVGVEDMTDQEKDEIDLFDETDNSYSMAYIQGGSQNE